MSDIKKHFSIMNLLGIVPKHNGDYKDTEKGSAVLKAAKEAAELEADEYWEEELDEAYDEAYELTASPQEPEMEQEAADESYFEALAMRADENVDSYEAAGADAEPVETEEETAKPAETPEEEIAEPIETPEEEIAEPIETPEEDIAEPIESSEEEMAKPAEAADEEIIEPAEIVEEAAEPEGIAKEKVYTDEVSEKDTADETADAEAAEKDENADAEEYPDSLEEDVIEIHKAVKADNSVRGKKREYTVLLVPNGAHRVHQFKFHFDTLVLLTLLLAVCLVGGVFYISTVASHIQSLEDQVEETKSEAMLLEEDNIVLQAQLEETESALHEAKVALEASKTVRQHEAEKQTEQTTPVMFPLGNMASMTAGYSEEHQYVEFTTGYGTKVIATADGVVSFVGADDTWGWKVTVDHGNGYETVYMLNVAPQVSTGDKVTRQNTLYTVDNDGITMAYQILFNGSPIDPTSVIQIDG